MTAPRDPRHDARFQRGYEADASASEPAEARTVARPLVRPTVERLDPAPHEQPRDRAHGAARGGRMLVLVGVALILAGTLTHLVGWVLPYLPVSVDVMRTTGSATQRIGWALSTIAPPLVTAGCFAFILVPLLRALRIASAVPARSEDEQGRPRADQ